MEKRRLILKAVKNILERDIKCSVPLNLIEKIDNAIKDEKIDLTILAKEIESHPLLTLKILKVANSPLYGFPQRISSVYHALILLGLQFDNPQKGKIGLLFLSDLFSHISSLKEYRYLDTIKGHPDLDLAFQYIQVLCSGSEDTEKVNLDFKNLPNLIVEFDEYFKTQKSLFEVII